MKQESPFCPNIAATPDGKQVWFTLKDIGRTVADIKKGEHVHVHNLKTKRW